MTMKKYLIALAVLVTALLSSCVQEKSFKDITVGENEMVFVMGGNATRSADGFSMAKKGAVIPMGKTDAGEPLFLEETIEELNPTMGTRGTPAYTSNVGKMYETMGVYSLLESFGDKTFEVMDEYPEHDDAPRPPFTDEDGWRYHHNYNGDPWPDLKTPVDFYLRMLGTGNGVNSLTLPTQTAPLSFDYTSPVGVVGTEGTPGTQGRDAEVQEDILFGFTSLSKEQHHHYLPNGAPVMMYHALTGIKFRNGHENEHSTKTIIKKVVISGLKNSGICEFLPEKSDFKQKFHWTVKSGTATFTQEFSNPTYIPASGEANSDGTVDFTNSSTNPDLYGTSWTNGTNADDIKKAAADHNLNDTDGSMTFWFVPQEMTDNVILEVTFLIKTPDTPDGTEITHTIKFGTTLNKEYHKNGKSGSVKWEAGQLRTYTLRPYDVDVDIIDSMTATVKSNIRIANTGNVDEYVRVLIMGNWYGWPSAKDKSDGKEPSILVGYKYPTREAAEAAGEDYYTMVLPWYREGYPCTDPTDETTIDESLDPKAAGVYMMDPYGHFDESFLLADLHRKINGADARDGKRNDWADASGGFYYTMKIGPGEGSLDTGSATKDLFKSYTVTKVPKIYLPSGNTRAEAYGVHLVMEIVVQAIEVPKDADGNDVWWLQAWYDATGVEKLKPTDDRNATYLAYYGAGEYNPNSDPNSESSGD